MYNVNFNISGDLHIHLGDDVLDSIFPDDLPDDEAEDEIDDFEPNEIAPSGLIVSVEVCRPTLTARRWNPSSRRLSSS